MPISLSEEVAELYYRKKGYIVEANIYYLGKRKSAKQIGNLEIDRLAIKPKEQAIIISCKRGSLDWRKRQHEKEVKLFELHEKFLADDKLWKPFLENCAIKKVYVAEYVSKRDKEFLEKHNIEVIKLKEMMQELIQLLKEEMTPKKRVGAETEILPRILKFLIDYGFMKITDVSISSKMK